MMRHTRAPQEGCGSSRVTCGRRKAARWVRLAMLAVLLASLGASHAAHAQDPSTLAPDVAKSTSFPKQSMVGPSRNIDKSQPLYLQGDELIYDTGGNKVIARGNVEIFYNNYILTADQVVYDQSANTLTAVGNVMLKEPNGNIVRADRYTLTDDFRDGFVSQLSIVAADDTRIAAEKATRRGGNTTVFTNGRFTPCKTTDGMPPLWCLSAADRYPRPGRRHHQLPGRAVRAVRRADPLHALLRARRPVGEAQVGLPDAAADDLRQPRLLDDDPVLLRAGAELRLHVLPDVHLAPGHPVAGRVAPSHGERPVLHPWHRHRSGCCRSAFERSRIATSTTAGAAASRPRACSISASWWKFGWDVTTESDDEFRRFYKLDNILLTDRVNKMFFAGLSDRNYFELAAYEFTDLGFTNPGASETKQYAHPIMDYNYVFADPILGGELTLEHQRAEPLQQSGPDDVCAVCRRQSADEPRGDGAELAPPPHRSDRHHLHAIRAAARRPLPDRQLHRSASQRRADREHLARPRPGARRRDDRLSMGGKHAALGRMSSSRSARSSPARRTSIRTACPTRTRRASCSTTPTCSR